MTENAKYNFLRIFEFSVGWHRRNMAFETAKIAYIAGATESKQLVKKPDFLFNTCIWIHHSRCASHITVPNYLFILTARIFFLARVISLPSKHENSSTLRGVGTRLNVAMCILYKLEMVANLKRNNFFYVFEYDRRLNFQKF